MNHSPRLPFSEAVAYSETLYISGQLGIDPITGTLPLAGFEAEADQAMKNLGELLSRFGLNYEALVHVTIYLKSMDNYAAVNMVYSRYFSSTFPARVCIAVLDLPLNANIEIAGIAGRKRPEKKTIPYYHVDVFSDKSFSGNGLTIFPESKSLSKALMQTITREMRQFESIFLRHRSHNIFEANVFTMEEELDFAGHPSLGAAALLHDLHKPEEEEAEWTLNFPSKKVLLTTKRKDHGYEATMNQGPAFFGGPLAADQSSDFLQALNLDEQDRHPTYPLQVVSTGLPYLLIPVQNGFWKARIRITDLTERLHAVGAQFIGILDITSRSIRTWDNLGLVEDIATGSLAGPAAAYLVKYGECRMDETILIHQGRNLERESQLLARVTGSAGSQGDIYVTGDVVMMAAGQLQINR